MKSGKRWIAVSVDQASHPVVGMHRPPPKPADPKRHAVAPYVAWQMLLIEAAWQDHKAIVGNTPITIRRGQTIIGRDYLAEKWNWTPKTVRGFLDLLVDEGMIEKGPSKGRLANIATICNYEKYQSVDDSKGPVEGTLGAGSGPVQGQTLTKDTNTPNNIINFSTSHQESARESDSPPASVEKPVRSKVARKRSSSFFVDPYERCWLNDAGKIEITDDLRADWLKTFDCDDRWLNLALIQAEGYVQENSHQPLEKRVASQIAFQAKDRYEKDGRYNGSKELAEKQKRDKFVKEALRRI